MTDSARGFTEGWLVKAAEKGFLTSKVPELISDLQDAIFLAEAFQEALEEGKRNAGGEADEKIRHEKREIAAEVDAAYRRGCGAEEIMKVLETHDIPLDPYLRYATG